MMLFPRLNKHHNMKTYEGVEVGHHCYIVYIVSVPLLVWVMITSFNILVMSTLAQHADVVVGLLPI
jgi:hypothetical protein